MSVRRPSSSAVTWLLFLGLSCIWGSSFLFIKIGIDEGLKPLTVVTYRLGIATVFLLAVGLLTGARIPRDARTLRIVGILGLVNVAVPFVLITTAEQYISSALAAILDALVPLFTIVFASLVLHDEPITLNRLAGLLIGFAGAVLLVSPNLTADAVGFTGTALAGDLMLVVACMAYAGSAVYIRRMISGKPLGRDPDGTRRPLKAVEVAIIQSVVAFALLLPMAIVVDGHGGPIALPPTLRATFAVTWIGLLGSGVAYLLLFRLIDAWGATRTTMVTYVMPVVGIALGVIVLSETLHPAEILGTILVIGGVVLANSRFGQRRLFGRAAAPPVGAPARAVQD
jgi:drug/metabolite transporter (DMT)-like permease